MIIKNRQSTIQISLMLYKVKNVSFYTEQKSEQHTYNNILDYSKIIWIYTRIFNVPKSMIIPNSF